MKAGESDHLGAYGFQWLGEEAMEAVGYNFAFASSDDSILDCWINDGSYIAALRPGVVTLSLYYRHCHNHFPQCLGGIHFLF